MNNDQWQMPKCWVNMQKCAHIDELSKQKTTIYLKKPELCTKYKFEISVNHNEFIPKDVRLRIMRFWRACIETELIGRLNTDSLFSRKLTACFIKKNNFTNYAILWFHLNACNCQCKFFWNQCRCVFGVWPPQVCTNALTF